MDGVAKPPGMIGAVAWSADGKQLYGGGTVDAGDAVQVVAWPECGRGQPMALPALIDSITDLETRPQGGVGLPSSDPGFGILGAPELARQVQGPVTADMRLKIADLFQITPDAIGGALRAQRGCTRAMVVRSRKTRFQIHRRKEPYGSRSRPTRAHYRSRAGPMAARRGPATRSSHSNRASRREVLSSRRMGRVSY